MAPHTDSQLLNIEVIEWVTSTVSILGTVFILGTFAFFKSFRKPINRLVSYASVGNILANGATMVARFGIRAGQNSALCKYQAYFIQVFLPADSLWTFCMAMNVYLTFFKNYNAIELRALEKWYIICCYSLPIIPATCILIYDATTKEHVYGDATLWCWIAPKYDWMRIAFFYGPVWVIIAVTSTIYIITGKDIVRQRKALRAFSKSPQASVPMIKNPFQVTDTVAVRKITEIHVTSESMDDFSSASRSTTKPPEAVKTSISSDHRLTVPSPHDRSKSERICANESSTGNQSPTFQAGGGEGSDIFSRGPAVECVATVSTGQQPTMILDSPKPVPGQSSAAMREHNAAMRANTAVWGYAKVAMLMFVAMLVIWVPSTVNRVYQMIYPDKPVFILSALAAAVLPMQGFWNCTIYIATSWPQCKDAYRQIGLDKLFRCAQVKRVLKVTTLLRGSSHSEYSEENDSDAGFKLRGRRQTRNQPLKDGNSEKDPQISWARTSSSLSVGPTG